MRTLVLQRCPGCGGVRFEPVPVQEADGLRRCLDCGTVSAAEYAEPGEVFQAGYLSGGTGAFGVDLSHPRMRAYVVAAGHARMEAIETAGGLRAGTLLDVGCGSGELVQAAGERGWRASGVEPLPDASEVARSHGLDVRTGLLEESGLPEASFDAVSAFHVLEHMSDGPAFLRTLARWVRPGGIVAVESPNWDAIVRARSPRAWRHLRPLEHLVHWTPATLRGAFERAGLEPLTVRTPSYLQRMQTLDEALDLLARPEWRRWLVPLSALRRIEGAPARVPRVGAWALLRATAAAYERRGRGDVVLGVARRPGA